MEKPMIEQLVAFNQLYKEMDKIYHLYAKRNGLSDTSFWLLYSLCESETYTQREICSAWHYPPQTINSALKNLERKGYLALHAIAGNQKNKRVVLTEKGAALAKSVVFPLIDAEQEAFEGLQEKDRNSLLAATQKYVELLHTAVNER